MGECRSIQYVPTSRSTTQTRSFFRSGSVRSQCESRKAKCVKYHLIASVFLSFFLFPPVLLRRSGSRVGFSFASDGTCLSEFSVRRLARRVSVKGRFAIQRHPNPPPPPGGRGCRADGWDRENEGWGERYSEVSRGYGCRWLCRASEIVYDADGV
ncbi:hypothetical protein BO82DRAFT_163425 [Aspergillus uvarum CBS 121591]|uniref:Uncharacterized protein n=1 Tax=Aspergillus uvarum CBS 121591 TaxID=1448315 RepID=A0A319CM07_9EURO|nr:hypothetical protein BO82DRAFT_163425 [Aspergillus uvarum CBS 121591]PYH85560.1 hypothetical protein BO82DRAFT_163425 [Aspergillus uvarum CBS 121591]